MAEIEEEERAPAPLNWRFVFGLVLAIGVPLSIVVRVFWIPHTLGAIGVGFTLGYAVALALMWTGRAPKEKKARTPAVMTADAWIYFRLSQPNAWLTVVNACDAPLRVPGLADGVALGLTIEVLEGDRTVTTISLAPRTPPPGPILEVPKTHYDFVKTEFNPEKSPSARTVRFDLGNKLKELPKGKYDLRVRWDLTPFAAPDLWTPPTPVVLGIFPYAR